ncbi:hypothetical protein VE03_10202 [Pseudogymnoascus sp. 23342-1-I1]|nr:hypothetical protein VE03_10202 [Pseudogymnoascus sp. 23342-1-I1]
MTMLQFRSILIHDKDMQKTLTIHAMASSCDWDPSLNDDSLTAEENEKNWLIRRALKWPLRMSGYESLESTNSAKVAQVEVDAFRASFLAMYDMTNYIADERALLDFRQELLDPAMAALKTAVANLKQPNLVPSRSGSASVRVPVPQEQASATKKRRRTMATQDQERESLGKKPPANSCLQPTEPSSPSKVTTKPLKSQKKPEKSPAKAPSAKTTLLKSDPPPILPPSSKALKSSPRKTSQAQPLIPSPTKAPAKKTPIKTILPPSGTRSSATTPLKTSPTKTTPAKSSILPSGKAPKVVGKSQTQLEKAPAPTPPAKPSPVKQSQPPSSFSPSKGSVEVSGSQTQQTRPRIDITAIQQIFLKPVASWSAEVRDAVGLAPGQMTLPK